MPNKYSHRHSLEIPYFFNYISIFNINFFQYKEPIILGLYR